MTFGQAMPIMEALSLLEALVNSLTPETEVDEHFKERAYTILEDAKDAMRELSPTPNIQEQKS